MEQPFGIQLVQDNEDVFYCQEGRTKRRVGRPDEEVNCLSLMLVAMVGNGVLGKETHTLYRIEAVLCDEYCIPLGKDVQSHLQLVDPPSFSRYFGCVVNFRVNELYSMRSDGNTIRLRLMIKVINDLGQVVGVTYGRAFAQKSKRKSKSFPRKNNKVYEEEKEGRRALKLEGEKRLNRLAYLINTNVNTACDELEGNPLSWRYPFMAPSVPAPSQENIYTVPVTIQRKLVSSSSTNLDDEIDFKINCFTREISFSEFSYLDFIAENDDTLQLPELDSKKRKSTEDLQEQRTKKSMCEYDTFDPFRP